MALDNTINGSPNDQPITDIPLELMEGYPSFDEWYRVEKDPWDIGKAMSSDYSVVIEYLRTIKPITVFDVGCGLGGLTKRINIEITPRILHAIDISDVAIRKAISFYSTIGVCFTVADIRECYKDIIGWDTVIMSEIGWYIAPQFPRIIRQLGKSNMNLIIKQTFPANQQHYRAIMSRPENLDDMVGIPLIKRWVEPDGKGGRITVRWYGGDI